MSATLLDAAEGIVTITLAGKLSPEDLAAAHASAGAYLRNWAGGSMLIHGERFEGWTREGDWADLAFQTANDDLIRKMAIVGDTRWKDLVVIFTQTHAALSNRILPERSNRGGPRMAEVLSFRRPLHQGAMAANTPICQHPEIAIPAQGPTP